jgi:hypothetical protein
VAAEVALGVVLDDDLPVVGLPERDGAVERADERVIGLDAAVEDANADPGPRRAPERPLPGDPIRPLDADPDRRRGRRRQAPGGKLLAGRALGLLL